MAQAGNVFAENVELDVYCCANFYIAEVRIIVRIGDYGYGKRVIGWCNDS